MALNRAEKAAGREFRSRAEYALLAAWNDDPDAASCSVRVRFFRHECRGNKGRTRAISLHERTVTSPEMWVEWISGDPRVLSRHEAEERVASGEAVEFETILAGKFSFTWKYGRCMACGLTVMSRAGVLKDERPDRGDKQDDLAVFTQSGLGFRLNSGTRREHDMP